jgi:5-methylcytosine-specific restriction endonuclease McrA
MTTKHPLDQRGTRAWRKLRLEVLASCTVCYLCRQAPATEVDHVKPVSTHPWLCMDVANLRGACRPCNRSKSDHDLGNRNPQTRVW